MSSAGKEVRWLSAHLHFGEEEMLVGRGGSGTVFFSHCTLSCVFCQNWNISQQGQGTDHSWEELAEVFLRLQDEGAENINLVTPTQYIYPIVQALERALQEGLDRPIVYNTNCYDNAELIALLDDVVDIWLPDFKYMCADYGQKLSAVANYPTVAKEALRAMYDQGAAVRMEHGVAQKGLIIRHLVLPGGHAGSIEFLNWLQREEMMDMSLSIMSQYHPQYQAHRYPEIDKTITAGEFNAAVDCAEKLGFKAVIAQRML
jgi:putative pyruvate formate lyase activating enzyme